MSEPNHHNIHAINLAPDATRELSGIKVTKDSKSYLVFWGATGVAVISRQADAPTTRPAGRSAVPADKQQQ